VGPQTPNTWSVHTARGKGGQPFKGIGMELAQLVDGLVVKTC